MSYDDDLNDGEQYVDREAIVRLDKDLRQAATMIGFQEARYLVGVYTHIQKTRVRAGNQIGAVERRGSQDPVSLLRWSFGNMRTVEEDIKSALHTFSMQYNAGRWLRGICGIGPVLGAGLLSMLDIRPRMIGPCQCKDPIQDKIHGPKHRVFKAVKGLPDKNGNLVYRCTGQEGKNYCDVIRFVPKDTPKSEHGIIQPITAGAWWRFAGLDPTVVWKPKERRPWNALLKVLCWKLGRQMCFHQVSRESNYYGPLFLRRKEYEIKKNEAGDYEEQAAAGAERVGKNTAAYKVYVEGKLPLGHIHNRAMRWTVKLFLSHYFHLCHWDYFGKEPPIPFVFSEHCDDGQDHKHFIPPPEVEIKKPGLPLVKLLDG